MRSNRSGRKTALSEEEEEEEEGGGWAKLSLSECRFKMKTHPPLSVRMLPFHPCRTCAPPTFSSVACPGLSPRWYVLLRQRLHPVRASCWGVRPLSEAWVATGMNMGSITGPWGRVRTEARALVVFSQKHSWSACGNQIRRICCRGKEC